MVACDRPFPIVVTTNGGYPLDQNLYQTVKGMSAGAQIVQDGGYILTAARCNDGFPAHGNFKRLLVEHRTPQAILDTVLTPGFSMFDQWEAQMLAMILVRARAGLYSEIPADELRQAHVEPVADVGARLAEELRHAGPRRSRGRAAGGADDDSLPAPLRSAGVRGRPRRRVRAPCAADRVRGGESGARPARRRAW